MAISLMMLTRLACPVLVNICRAGSGGRVGWPQAAGGGAAQFQPPGGCVPLGVARCSAITACYTACSNELSAARPALQGAAGHP